MTHFPRVVVLLFVCGLILVRGPRSWAQEKAQAPVSPSSCTRENALQIIQQQIDLAKTFDDDVRRIAVLLRAADLIWPYQQVQARASFTEAFDVASRNFKEKGDKPRNEGRLVVGVPDQRYTVIGAIAKRDPDWAGKLSKQILQEEADEAKEKAEKEAGRDAQTGAKLLGVATSLLGSDPAAALPFARNSLTYPATLYLPQFLFKLSEIDKGARTSSIQRRWLPMRERRWPGFSICRPIPSRATVRLARCRRGQHILSPPG
jgi:hypothetical protein